MEDEKALQAEKNPNLNDFDVTTVTNLPTISDGKINEGSLEKIFSEKLKHVSKI